MNEMKIQICLEVVFGLESGWVERNVFFGFGFGSGWGKKIFGFGSGWENRQPEASLKVTDLYLRSQILQEA